jgi:hypothetical protein
VLHKLSIAYCGKKGKIKLVYFGGKKTLYKKNLLLYNKNTHIKPPKGDVIINFHI